MVDFTVVIPARYASSRLPGKPLADIAGKSMIQRVYEAAQKSDAKEVLVATDDQRVFDAVTRFGGEACMTSVDHQSGTDRLQEVCQQKGYADDHIVVNVQGDEPLIPAAVINQVARNLIAHSDAACGTLCEPIELMSDLFDENIVKVVFNAQGYANYFSRAPIPWAREKSQFKNYTNEPCYEGVYRHIGIYSYRVSLLNAFIRWDAAPLETCEKLEQLRILHNNKKIHVDVACDNVPAGIDTPEDLIKINQLF